MNDLKMTERTFKLWDYHASHQHLLLRSPKSPGTNFIAPTTTNIDIRFMGVDYLNIPTIIRGCSIVEANAEEIETIDSLFPNRSDANKIFIIASAGNRYSIVAVAYKISENELDIFQTTLDRYEA
jgi:ribulose 1,5-bisphosphate carboxylase large subunit-like protein